MVSLPIAKRKALAFSKEEEKSNLTGHKNMLFGQKFNGILYASLIMDRTIYGMFYDVSTVMSHRQRMWRCVLNKAIKGIKLVR